MEKETIQLDFEKMGGLVPAVVQDDVTQKVLMVGFMNEAAFHKTLDTNRVTFFSRTKGRLWTKGEQSGNFLEVKSILPDCDNDTLLIKATPCGPVCHTGTDTCFGEKNEDALSFIGYLQDFIERRKQEMPQGSYTTSLFQSGINRMAQKVGEEAVETVIEATNGTDDRLIYEGEAIVLDFDVRHLKNKEIPNLRRKLGIVFQDFQLLTDRSVYENLAFVLRATGWKDREEIDTRVSEVLDQVGMRKKSYKMPHELSGGEQQRIVIARALLNSPKIILADEPTGNLDPQTGQQIVSLLHHICETGTAVIMTTHNLNLVEEFPGRILKCEDKSLVEV